MEAATAPYLAAAFLLVVAGLAKVARPLSLVRALRTAGVPMRAPLLARWVRVAALVEAAIGAVAIGAVAVGQPSRAAAVLVAASYAGFTLFVLQALRSGSPLASCGCFGKTDTPPTPGHAVLTAVLTIAAGLLATGSPAPLGVSLLAVSAVLAYLSYLVLAVLPLVSRRALR